MQITRKWYTLDENSHHKNEVGGALSYSATFNSPQHHLVVAASMTSFPILSSMKTVLDCLFVC